MRSCWPLKTFIHHMMLKVKARSFPYILATLTILRGKVMQNLTISAISNKTLTFLMFINNNLHFSLKKIIIIFLF